MDIAAEETDFLPASGLDLAATLNSGQVFHWTAVHGWWHGALGDTAVKLKQGTEGIHFAPRSARAALERYFGVHLPWQEYQKNFPIADGSLAAAVAFCPGLRILRQPAWECLATFITSALKQVPHIRQISLKMRQELGRRLDDGIYCYPTAEQVAEAGEAKLRELGLGFRAKNLQRTAEWLQQHPQALTEWEGLDDTALEEALVALPGVGKKIAHCTLLFGFGRLGAFPVDVWVERVLRQLYLKGRRKLTQAQIAAFAQKHFGPQRGFAQQFLFHHARLTKLG